MLPAIPLMLLMFADAPGPKPEPRITAEQQLAYFQARAELAEQKLAALEAEKPVAAAVADLQKTCPVTLDDKRRPVCVKPEPPKTEPKK